ncbi:hypothetical protein FRC02_001027 [Tulasnella sp. 418]|nr:hypothetical protein FRC02_001027 [Tulasnella sp. 418]
MGKEKENSKTDQSEPPTRPSSRIINLPPSTTHSTQHHPSIPFPTDPSTSRARDDVFSPSNHYGHEDPEEMNVDDPPFDDQAHALYQFQTYLSQAVHTLQEIDPDTIYNWPKAVHNSILAIVSTVGVTKELSNLCTDNTALNELSTTVKEQNRLISLLKDSSPKTVANSNPEETNEGNEGEVRGTNPIPKSVTPVSSQWTKSVRPEPIRPTPKAKATVKEAAPEANKKANPRARNSPLRLIIRYDSPIQASEWIPSLKQRELVNQKLTEAKVPEHVRVTAVNYTDLGNVVLLAREPATAKDLYEYVGSFALDLAPSKSTYQAMLDLPWHKVQLNGAFTRNGRGDVIDTREELMEELIRENQWIQNEMLVELPRWLTSPEALENRTRVSFVVTFKDEKNANKLLKERKGAFFLGDWIKAKAFEDKRPFRQCGKCFSLKHSTRMCKSSPRCKYCPKDHATEAHICETCTAADGCDHDKCCNCGGDHAADYKQCPEKVKAVGLHASAKTNKKSMGEARVDANKENPKADKPRRVNVSQFKKKVRKMCLSVSNEHMETLIQTLKESGEEAAMQNAKVVIERFYSDEQTSEEDNNVMGSYE